MFDRLTTKARRAMGQARFEAIERRQPAIGPEHILLAVLAVSDASAAVILRREGVDPSEVVRTLEARLPAADADSQTVTRQIPFARAAKRVLEAALSVATAHEQHAIRTAHLLLGVLGETEGIAGHVAHQLGLDLDALRKAIRGLPDMAPEASEPVPRTRRRRRTYARKPAIARDLAFAPDLLEEARRAPLEPIVGREQEIRRCANVLARARNTGVVLVGEPGVGKSAVVEGLAQEAIDGAYQGIASIRRLDVPLMLAGSKRRGVLEGRIDRIVREALVRPACILVIDDLHRVVEAGSDDDAGWWNRFRWMLKPVIEQGTLGVIGVADRAAMEALRRGDPAFWACFQTVVVNAPSPEETQAILAAHRPRLEAYHGVKIADGILAAVVELVGRHLPDVGSPRAALALLDLALARARLGGEGVVDHQGLIGALSEMTGLNEERFR